MKVDNLIIHIATGETDKSFVGLKIIGNQIHFYVPESYHFDADNFERDDFLDLLKSISIARSFSSDASENYESHKENSESALLSYIWIIEDYLKNGFFISNELLFRINQRGRINWKRTIQQQPIISRNNIVFPNLVAEVKSPHDNLISDAYRYCVKKSATVIGWIYGVRPESIEIPPNAENMIPIYIDAIISEMNSSFDDKKQLRLRHMKSVLIGLDEVLDNNNIVYGVDTYHYVFERMVNSIFGTERADDYYPTFVWNLNYSNKGDRLNGPTIRPDTIMRCGINDDLYIIDSKYYRYGNQNMAQTKGLPGASSIVKQIAYGAYVQSKFPNSCIYNIFILPYDSKSQNAELIKEDDKHLVYVGDVSSAWSNEKSYGRIHTFLVDLRYVVKTWNRMAHDEERKLLAKIVQLNECK